MPHPRTNEAVQLGKAVPTVPRLLLLEAFGRHPQQMSESLIADVGLQT